MSTITAQVTVYTRVGCVACMATFRALTKAGIGYEAIDVTNNRTLEDELRDLGAMRMPVVMTGDGTGGTGTATTRSATCAPASPSRSVPDMDLDTPVPWWPVDDLDAPVPYVPSTTGRTRDQQDTTTP